MTSKTNVVTAALNLLCKDSDLTETTVRKKLDKQGHSKEDVNKAIIRLNALDMLDPMPVAKFLARKYSIKAIDGYINN